MKIIFIIFFSALSQFSFGQNFQWVDVGENISNLMAGYEMFNKVVNDDLGNSYVLGDVYDSIEVDSTIIHSQGVKDLVLYKFDPGGSLQWTQQIKPSAYLAGLALVVHHDVIYISASFVDTVVINGNTFVTTPNTLDFFLASYNTNGNLRWVKDFHHPSYYNNNSDIYAMTVDPAGYIYATGEFGDSTIYDQTILLHGHNHANVFIMKLDSLGQIYWFTNYYSSTVATARAIFADSTNNIFVTGGSYDTLFTPSDTVVGEGAYISRINATTGQDLWTIIGKGGSSEGDYGTGICADGQSMVYATGSIWGDVNFTGDTLFATFNGDCDQFLVKIDYNGNPVWQKKFGGSSYDQGSEIQLSSGNLIYVLSGAAIEFDGTPVPASTNLYVINTAGTIQTYIPFSPTNPECLISSFQLGINNTIDIVGSFITAANFSNNTANCNSGLGCGYISKIDDQINSITNLQTEKEIISYPNPTTEILNLDGLNSAFSYSITNLVGRNFQTGIVDGNKKKVNTGNLEDGVYFLILRNATKEKTIPFIKIKS